MTERKIEKMGRIIESVDHPQDLADAVNEKNQGGMVALRNPCRRRGRLPHSVYRKVCSRQRTDVQTIQRDALRGGPHLERPQLSDVPASRSRGDSRTACSCASRHARRKRALCGGALRQPDRNGRKTRSSVGCLPLGAFPGIRKRERDGAEK